MKRIAIGKSKKCKYDKWIPLIMLFLVRFFASCTPPSYVTVMDSYFVHNQSENTIQLVFNQSVVWDTCTSGNGLQRVWYDSSTISVNKDGRIRLHPIRREFTNDVQKHICNVIPIIGSSVLLIADKDTIEWRTEDNRSPMFTCDTIWSIYNTEDWNSELDAEMPYTYYHTFVITAEKIERSRK